MRSLLDSLPLCLVSALLLVSASSVQAVIIPVNSDSFTMGMTINTEGTDTATVNYNINGTAYNSVALASQTESTFAPGGFSLVAGGTTSPNERYVHSQSFATGDYGLVFHFEASPGRVFTSFTFDPGLAINVNVAGRFVRWEVSTDGVSYTQLAQGDNTNLNYYSPQYDHRFGTLNAFPAVGTDPTDIYVRGTGNSGSGAGPWFQGMMLGMRNTGPSATVLQVNATTIPEPASAALIAVGLGILAVRRRFR